MSDQLGDPALPSRASSLRSPEPASGLGHSVTPAIAYPDGAITSVADLKQRFNAGESLLIESSREFGCSKRDMRFTGRTGVDTHTDGWKYEWFHVVTDNGLKRKRSVVDMHLKPQTYNDWFLFTDRAKAEAYAQGIEAGTAETEGLGAKHESPTPQGDAPKDLR